MSNVYLVNLGNAIVTVNKNYDDEATRSSVCVKSGGDKVKICKWSQGDSDGEPRILSDGPCSERHILPVVVVATIIDGVHHR